MDRDTGKIFTGYTGRRSDLCDIKTGKKIGTIFVFTDNGEQVARFLEFNEMRAIWCFAEVPEVTVDDLELLATLKRQLLAMHITLIPHPQDAINFETIPTEPRYLQ